ncbi:MAG TPA: 1,4-dihydroxy-2-naphthoate polyprenyltransferase [Acidimicrobiia bacterium]|nr:1,4-dihydroxy-2-naphthoate polyprenyltransferase [Acidimicrobiia bacterium]
MALLRRQTPDARRQTNPWVQAARLRTLPAAIVPVLVGSAAASYDRVFDWRAFLLALVGALAIQVAANFANDASDAARGADPGDRVGPRRMVASGVITARQMWIATAGSIALAVAAGIGLTILAGPVVILIGVASVVAMLGYVGGPIPYGYRGLGELFVFLFFGLVATGGSRLVHDGSVPGWVWFAGVPIGMLVTAILVANNLRDITTDARVGKRTLAVMLGRTSTRRLYAGLTWGAIVVTVVLGAARIVPVATLAVVLVVPMVPRLNRIAGKDEPATLVPLLSGTARLHLFFGLLFSAGIASVDRIGVIN